MECMLRVLIYTLWKNTFTKPYTILLMILFVKDITKITKNYNYGYQEHSCCKMLTCLKRQIK